MTNFNFKFLGAWLVIVASITGLQAQNDSTLKGKDEMVPAGVWNDVNGEYINAHGGGILLFDSKYYYCCPIKILRSYKIRADFICEVSPFSLDFSRQTIKSNHGQKYTF